MCVDRILLALIKAVSDEDQEVSSNVIERLMFSFMILSMDIL